MFKKLKNKRLRCKLIEKSQKTFISERKKQKLYSFRHCAPPPDFGLKSDAKSDQNDQKVMKMCAKVAF